MTKGQLCTFIFFVVAGVFAVFYMLFLASIADAADGLNMRDPIFEHSNSPATKNRIQWDGSRRQTQYWLNDPIFDDGRFIIWIKPDPTPAAKPTGTYSADGGILFDYDPVGE